MKIFNIKKKTKNARDLLNEKIIRGRQGYCESYDDAVKVGAKTTFEGIKMEYAYISIYCGNHDVDWQLISKATSEKNGKMFDVFDVREKNGNERTFYFDISKFYGKF